MVIEDKRTTDSNISQLRQEVRELTMLLSANTKITNELAANVAGLVSAWEAGKWFVHLAKFGATLAVAVAAVATWLHAGGHGK